jgi:hypothetical protein
MQTVPVTRQHLLGSVIAVPPLARNEDYTLNREANRALIRHIEAGGVSTLLYGGNANFYHLRLSEFGSALEMLATEFFRILKLSECRIGIFFKRVRLSTMLQGWLFPFR